MRIEAGLKKSAEPRGVDLLKTLIDLLAEQEGVKIKYELIGGAKNELDRRSAC